jgi:hypothetical protein
MQHLRHPFGKRLSTTPRRHASRAPQDAGIDRPGIYHPLGSSAKRCHPDGAATPRLPTLLAATEGSSTQQSKRTRASECTVGSTARVPPLPERECHPDGAAAVSVSLHRTWQRLRDPPHSNRSGHELESASQLRERVNPPLGRRQAPARAAGASRPGLQPHVCLACHAGMRGARSGARAGAPHPQPFPRKLPRGKGASAVRLGEWRGDQQSRLAALRDLRRRMRDHAELAPLPRAGCGGEAASGGRYGRAPDSAGSQPNFSPLRTAGSCGAGPGVGPPALPDSAPAPRLLPRTRRHPPERSIA